MQSKFTANDYARKLVHVTFGLTLYLLFITNLFPIWVYIIILILGIVISLLLRSGKHLFGLAVVVKGLEKNHFSLPGQGAIFFLMGFIIILFLAKAFNLEDGLITVPLLIVTFADPASFFIGKSLGTHPLIFNKHKTVEGSLGGMLVALLVCIWTLPLVIALPTAVLSMLPDTVDVRIGKLEIDDNLFIQLTAFIVMLVLTHTDVLTILTGTK